MDFGEVTPGKKLSQGRPNPSGLYGMMVPTRQSRGILTQPSWAFPFQDQTTYLAGLQKFPRGPVDKTSPCGLGYD